METELNKEPIHILVLDDEYSIRWVLERTLTQAGYTPHLASNAPEARQLLRKHSIRLALVDINLPGLDGLSFTREILLEYPLLLTIVMTGQNTMYNTVEAMKAGAFDYVAKPFDIEEIEELVKSALSVPLLISDSNGLKKVKVADDLLTGQSKVMRDLYKAIGRVAATDLTVLVQGESGTGKELLARAIHYNSGRVGHPFVAINCATLPENLLESELFGYERGAFTGAEKRKIGRFELAAGGTLFLDEIGEMTLAVQVKLLRVLELREFSRLGSTETLRADVRLIVATNRDLADLVSKRLFREDLYYRINVFPITIPPLHERTQDILPLARHFLLELVERTGKMVTDIRPEARRTLLNYGWPGNVRELKNVLERAVILTQDNSIGPEHLPVRLQEERVPLANVAVSLPREGLSLEEIERSLLKQALERSRHNKSKAARLLGMSRATLRYRLKKFSLDAA